MDVAIAAVIVTVIGVLAFSTIGKLRGRAAFHAFVEAIAGLQAIPARWSRSAAVAALLAETVVLVLLVWPATVTAGLAAATLLFGGFAVVLARAVRRGS